MIHRHYKQGQLLNVADLNEMIVLLDRTETERTEVALNSWRAGLVGPPHSHDQKEQIFFITAGSGRVVVGREMFQVGQGQTVYVPRGLEHQTIADEHNALDYLLLNVFNNPEKEGHGTFAEHIEKVKEVRRRQAELGQAHVEQAEHGVASDKPARCILDTGQGRIFGFGSNTTRLLLDRSETEGFELVVVSWPPGNIGAMVAHKEKEQTFFILSGSGWVTVDDAREAVVPGDVVFVPRNHPHTTEAGAETLTYLCLNTLIVRTDEGTFEEMYHRVAPARMERWKRGDQSVGD